MNSGDIYEILNNLTSEIKALKASAAQTASSRTSITAGSSVSASTWTCYYRRFGKMVLLEFRFYLTSTVSSTSAIIDAGAIPTPEAAAYGVLCPQSSSQAPVRLTANTSGTITVSSSLSTGVYYIGQMIYFTS